jgi:hypothetical protein
MADRICNRSGIAAAAVFAVGEAMSTWQFYLVFLMLFLNVSAGIMVISQASPRRGLCFRNRRALTSSFPPVLASARL